MAETEFTIEPGRQDIVITRVYDAPRDVVFKAMTDPSLIPSWWGPARYPTVVDTMDPQAGGRWRFISSDDENEFAFNGVYHEVSSERIIQTFEWEGMPGHVSLETVNLEEVDGKTKYAAVTVFQSVADRDSMVQDGMQEGASETMDRLGEVIQRLR